jgi:fructan beta-fructosidase
VSDGLSFAVLPSANRGGHGMIEQRIRRNHLQPFARLMVTAAMLGVFVQACSRQPAGQLLPLNEPYRPQYHFSPPEHWMNDPNGLVYMDGEFHLFYQHNPPDVIWGPMHWGHAVSTDLVDWQNLPIALYPDALGNIFSGSAVVDQDNTAGFGANAIVATFTHDQGGEQRQSLAYSTDKGRMWTKYAGNPVLNTPNNLKNFRDPKVFWYGEGATGHWVMAVAAGNIILFYTSPDLKNWTPVSGFGLGYGSIAGVWETPDLSKLSVDGGSDTRWVLSVGGNGAPAGGTGVQYFVGNFDGKTFTSENPKPTVLWADFGADFYAVQAWNNVPDGRHIWAAWMNNWTYAQNTPTSTWRGALTLLRELALSTTSRGVRLTQKPIAELQRLRGEHWGWQDQTIPSGVHLLSGAEGDTLEISADFQVDVSTSADRFGLRVRVGKDEYNTIGYATKNQMLFVDRSQSGQVDFSPNFTKIHTVKMEPAAGMIRLHIFVDRASVEVFGNDGLVTITDQIFPASDSLGVETFADSGQVLLKSLEIYKLEPAKFLAIPAR